MRPQPDEPGWPGWPDPARINYTQLPPWMDSLPRFTRRALSRSGQDLAEMTPEEACARGRLWWMRLPGVGERSVQALARVLRKQLGAWPREWL